MNVHQAKKTTLKHLFLLNKEEADEVLKQALNSDFTNRMGGRNIIQFGKDYVYSGKLHKGEAIPEWLQSLIEEVNTVFDTEFNSILLNHYPAGTTVGIGMHSDNEPELGDDPEVVSLSLGQTIIFKIQGQGEYLDVDLSHGEALYMGKGCQQYYRHGIPRQFMTEDRVSLTFRKFI